MLACCHPHITHRITEDDEEEDDEKKKGEGDDALKKKKKKKKRLGKSIEEASLDPNRPPAKLTSPLLERLMRIWVMLSQVGGLVGC